MFGLSIKERIEEIEENLDANVKWLSEYIKNSNELNKILMDRLREEVNELRLIIKKEDK